METAKTDRLEDFFRYVRAVTKGCRHPKQTIAALEKGGFKRIGSGAYKIVVRHNDYPEWVVKAFRSRTFWYYDHSTCGIIPKALQAFWLKNVFAGRRYVIQPYANGIGGTDKEANEWFKRWFKGKGYSRFDIHFNNARYHNNKPVIIDFSDINGRNHPKYRWPRLEPLKPA